MLALSDKMKWLNNVADLYTRILVKETQEELIKSLKLDINKLIKEKNNGGYII